MDSNARILALANRFEALAAEGFDGNPYEEALAGLVGHVRAEAGTAPRVAHALGIMVRLIRESDPAGRFARKIAILEEAISRLAA